ncbi:MAG: type II toxin-antitoxin system HicA family toxin [Bacteroidales bacterium]|nr:type II toxin-antitoxin system HicA family toxin [Bacteroidales bacterium]
MGTKEKLVERLKATPVDFTWSEASRLLSFLGYTKSNKGKTSGSRVCFSAQGKAPILLHRPHPANEMKRYAVIQLLQLLQKNGDI